MKIISDDFSAWTVDTMQTYLADCGLLGNEEFMLLPLIETAVAPLYAAGGFMYMDSDAASVMNVIYVMYIGCHLAAQNKESLFLTQLGEYQSG